MTAPRASQTTPLVEELWRPSEARVRRANLTRFRDFVTESIGTELPDYDALHAWSIADAPTFWQTFARFCELDLPCDDVLRGDGIASARWFSGATLNYAEVLLERASRRAGPVVLAVREDGEVCALDAASLRRHVVRTAHALRRRGVGPGDRVAAYVSNGVGALVVMLAAAALGAVFMSCDCGLGVSSVVDRFGVAAPKVLVAAETSRANGVVWSTAPAVAALRAALPSIVDVILCDATSGLPRVEADDDEVFAFPRFAFDHPLFILFSSGTTGAPKAIVHRAGGVLLKHMTEQALHSDIQSGDTVFYFTNCSWMMWNWLVSVLAQGATILLYEGGVAYPSLRSLWELVPRFGITHFGTSAFYVEACMAADLALADIDLRTLRAVLSTGSPLSPKGFRWIYGSVKRDVHLASISGGTDIVGCFMLGDPTAPVFAGQIQRPALGVDLAVFTSDGRDVRGEKGELVCRNAIPSMPLGFWNDPDGAAFHAAYLTRFPGLWCHGDTIERTAEGGIVVVGRSDATIKRGGVRIGTAEIYRALQDVPAVVKGCAVGVRSGSDEAIWLFVVLRDGEVFSDVLAAAIEDAIVTRNTPTHAPAHIVPVAELPHTQNGKLMELAVKAIANGEPVGDVSTLANRASLVTIEDAVRAIVREDEAVSARVTTARSSPLESRLEAIFAATLGRGRVDVEQSFFRLGGTSLSAMRARWAIESEFNVTITPELLRRNPSVRALAEVMGGTFPDAVREALARPPRSATPASLAPRVDAMLPFQRELWEWSRRSPERFSLNILRAFELEGPLDVDALRASMRRLLRRHAALRTIYPIGASGEPAARVVDDDTPDFVERDLRGMPEPRRIGEMLVLFEGLRVLAFGGTASPVRFLLVRLADDRHALGIAFDHMVIDRRSLETVVADLAWGYDEALGKAVSPSPPAPPSAAAFTAWLLGQAPPVHPRFWERRLAGLEATSFGTPAPHDAHEPWCGPAGIAFEFVPPPAVKELRRLVTELGTTLPVLVTATIAVMLHRHTGRTDLCLASIFGNRIEPRFEETVGCFASPHLPLRLTVDPDGTLAELATQIEAVYVEAVSAQYAPIPPSLRPHLYNVFVNYLPAGGSGQAAFHGLAFKQLPLPISLTTNECMFAVDEAANGGLSFVFLHHARTMSAGRAAECLRTLTELLPRLARQGRLPVGAALAAP